MSEKRLFMKNIKSRCERYAVRSDVCELNTMDQRFIFQASYRHLQKFRHFQANWSQPD